MTPDLAKAMGLNSNTRGALIETVAPGGPAENAGIQPSMQQATVGGQAVSVGGDIVTAIDGQAVRSFDDLGSYLFLHTTAGQTVTLTVLRNGRTGAVKVTTGTIPQQ
jgi:S1-C subfamily serine protease